MRRRDKGEKEGGEEMSGIQMTDEMHRSNRRKQLTEGEEDNGGQRERNQFSVQKKMKEDI